MDESENLYDIFEHLEGGQTVIKTSFHELEERVQQLTEDGQELRSSVAKLESQNENLMKQNEVLIRNISCLFKTAQMEIARKDKLIKSLQEGNLKPSSNAFASDEQLGGRVQAIKRQNEKAMSLPLGSSRITAELPKRIKKEETLMKALSSFNCDDASKKRGRCDKSPVQRHDRIRRVKTSDMMDTDGQTFQSGDGRSMTSLEGKQEEQMRPEREKERNGFQRPHGGSSGGSTRLGSDAYKERRKERWYHDDHRALRFTASNHRGSSILAGNRNYKKHLDAEV